MSEIQFTLRETPVTDKEAAALLKHINGDEPLKIEITKFVKINKLNPKNLFLLSVQENNPDLASLAWRLSTGMDVTTPLSKNNKKPIGPSIPEAERTTSRIIKEITESKSKWAIGAAIIMWALYEPENIPYNKEHELTIREVCAMVVNYMALNGYSDKYAKLYKGYVQQPNGQWVPNLGADQKKDRYHFSQLYTCGRQGLLWLKENGLIETEKKISYGSVRSETAESAKYTQRKYYSIKGTQFGEDCYDAHENWIQFALTTAI